MLKVIICVLIFIQIKKEILLLGVTQHYDHVESHFCFCYYPSGKISQPQTLSQIEEKKNLPMKYLSTLYMSYLSYIFFSHTI